MKLVEWPLAIRPKMVVRKIKQAIHNTLTTQLLTKGRFMSIFKKCFSLLPLISIAIATTATANTQCVNVEIPKFNLIPDSNCSISTSKLVQSKAPDQVFLYDFGLVDSCFSIFNAQEENYSVAGKIINQDTGIELPIKVSGVAGLTLNGYPNGGIGQSGALSFTAATLVSISTSEGKELGPLITRDAGTIFTDGNVAARLSVIKGEGIFRGATGYIDEVGQEFNPYDPAKATGTLCGKGLADSLFSSN
jgi:hypothetical protein